MPNSGDYGDHQNHRRVDDRDRALISRLDTLERHQQESQVQAARLSSDMTAVKLEQLHAKELFDLRFRAIETLQMQHGAKLDDLKTMLSTWATEADKSPMGRSMIVTIEEVVTRVSTAEEDLRDLRTWKHQFTGGMWVLRTASGLGVFGLILALLRMLKLLP